jgi:hypothetical protein
VSVLHVRYNDVINLLLAIALFLLRCLVAWSGVWQHRLVLDLPSVGVSMSSWPDPQANTPNALAADGNFGSCSVVQSCAVLLLINSSSSSLNEFFFFFF